MTVKDTLLAILVAFLWGANYVAMKSSITDVPGFFATANRFLITALILLPFISKLNISLQKLYPISIVSGLYIGLIYYGMHIGINTCLGIILMQLNAPFTVILARIFLKEEISLVATIGIIIAFIGMTIVVGAPSAVGNYFAVFVVFMAAIFCAVFSIQSKNLITVPPIDLIFWTHLIATPHLFLISYFLEGKPIDFWYKMSVPFWLYILYSALISCIIGIALRIYLLRKYPVYKVVPFNLLVPFFGFTFTIIFEKAFPSWHIFIGGGVLILGVAITQINFKWKRKKILL